MPPELGYQDRGNRCEGLFVQPVSTSGLRIVAYQPSQNRFPDNGILTSINAAHEGAKEVVVTSTRKRQYFRMDTRFSSLRFGYPLDLVKHPDIDIAAQELGVIACVAGCDTLVPELVPANISDTLSNEVAPFLTIQAARPLHQIRLTIATHPDGTVLFDKEMLKNTVWEAWRPAEIPVGRFLDEGGPIKATITVAGRTAGDVDVVAAILRPPQRATPGE